MTRAWPGRSWIRWLLVWRVATGMAAIYFTCCHRWRRREAVSLPPEGPILFVANHQSFYDPPMVGSKVQARCPAMLARASLFRNPFFGRLIRFLNAIPLDQSGRGAGAFRSALAELDARRSVMIFPEGRRSPDGTVHAFSPGLMLLVRRAKPWVVPVGIEGAFDAFPASASRPRWGVPIATSVGEAIPAEELLAMSTADALEHLRHRVEELRMQCRGRIRERSNGRWPSAGPADRPYWEAGADADDGDGNATSDED